MSVQDISDVTLYRIKECAEGQCPLFSAARSSPCHYAPKDVDRCQYTDMEIRPEEIHRDSYPGHCPFVRSMRALVLYIDDQAAYDKVKIIRKAVEDHGL